MVQFTNTDARNLAQLDELQAFLEQEADIAWLMGHHFANQAEQGILES